MNLTWYGTAALLLRSGDSAIAFDPFLGIPLGDREPGRVQRPNDFDDVTDVFVTHGHFDHILQIPALFLSSGATVHVTGMPEALLLRHRCPPGMLDGICEGLTREAGAFTVRVLKGKHCRFNAGIIFRTAFSARTWANAGHMLSLLRLNWTFLENGETVFYEVSAEGKRVQIMGSLGLDPNTDYPTGADVLILPFQGRSDLEAYAAPIVRSLAPKQVLLDHYDDSFPPMTTQVETARFEALLTREYGIPCSALRKNETITL